MAANTVSLQGYCLRLVQGLATGESSSAALLCHLMTAATGSSFSSLLVLGLSLFLSVNAFDF